MTHSKHVLYRLQLPYLAHSVYTTVTSSYCVLVADSRSETNKARFLEGKTRVSSNNRNLECPTSFQLFCFNKRSTTRKIWFLDVQSRIGAFARDHIYI